MKTSYEYDKDIQWQYEQIAIAKRYLAEELCQLHTSQILMGLYIDPRVPEDYYGTVYLYLPNDEYDICSETEAVAVIIKGGAGYMSPLAAQLSINVNPDDVMTSKAAEQLKAFILTNRFWLYAKEVENRVSETIKLWNKAVRLEREAENIMHRLTHQPA